MNFSDMQESVVSVIRDASKSFVTDPDVENWLNEGQREISHRLGLSDGETTGTTSGSTIALPTGFTRVITLRLGSATDKDDVQFVNDDVYNSWVDTGDDPGDTLGRIFNGNVELYPTPTTGTSYTFRYEKELTDLATTSESSSSGLPTFLHAACVNFARAQAMWKIGDNTRADVYFQLFEKGLRDFRRDQSPKIEITPTLGYFDSSDYLS